MSISSQTKGGGTVIVRRPPLSEELLVCHCAPTLAGIKCGSLFSCPYEDKSQVISDLRGLNHRLVPKGLRVLPLSYSDERVLIYAYRPASLAADLSNHEAHALLAEAGYRDESADRCVLELIRRLGAKECFPHEIGLFLGYPPEDVRGFIENKARGYLCAGYWKVYGDERKAKKTFDRYKRCTERYLSQWSKGVAVELLDGDMTENELN